MFGRPNLVYTLPTRVSSRDDLNLVLHSQADSLQTDHLAFVACALNLSSTDDLILILHTQHLEVQLMTFQPQPDPLQLTTFLRVVPSQSGSIPLILSLTSLLCCTVNQILFTR